MGIESSLYNLARSFLFMIDPEKAHNFFLEQGEKRKEIESLQKLLSCHFNYKDKRLKTQHFGISFDNPVGLAAGFDKNARVIELLPYLGFGFAEIGSVTAEGGKGNDKPRLFRLYKDEALINRMGLNNEGADVIAERLAGIDDKVSIPYGINIAKTHDPKIMGDKAIDDYVYSFKKMIPFGSYIVLNISCPNTTEGKTFEDPSILGELLSAVKNSRERYDKPVLVKLSPDLEKENLMKILAVCYDYSIDGFVSTNTSMKRDGLKTDQKKLDNIGIGGLSGKPLYPVAVEQVRTIKKEVPDAFIIGCGGISSADDAYGMIEAGASLVQVYTGLVYQGPSLIKNINMGLIQKLNEHNTGSLASLVKEHKS